ncbi:DEAD/DEAH box helicase family protein [Propionivibrio sp.]|uniref:DEAD/DEAH box helicase family protein n=1 Tax=Propionivibrio sp. TaxID=2212460 RepID=UPI003BF109F4
MALVKRSGHAKLKAALVLRDALLAELGLMQLAAMQQLRNVEENIGAEPGLAEGKYLDALLSVCKGSSDHLITLDGNVRAACLKAGLSPRYAQYLALVLFAHWVTAQQDDPAAFLIRLNEYLTQHQPKDADFVIQPFSEADLQLAAFWMATAAGKTHVLHACLALLEKLRPWNSILIITPSESLTRQHAEKLRALAAWDVFAYPMDGDASALGRLPPDTVIVLDINKLAVEKKGDGLTVPTHVFKDGCNLVFVDEGHKGLKTEDSTWKALQADLAGIDATETAHRGLLIEFSATFGQVAEGEHAFGRYAKAVIFDYAYDRFHQDRYGKDFWHLRLQGKEDTSAILQQQTLTAALLAFWHQRITFASSEAREAVSYAGLQVAAPLWVLLGLSVIGGSSAKKDVEQTSDVVDVLRFLHITLTRPNELRNSLDQLLGTAGILLDILPGEVRAIASALPREALVKRVLTDVFGWHAGDKAVFRIIRSASGELGLGLLRGDSCHYFGVVNVGDASGLKKKMEENGLAVEEDAMSSSLFAALDAAGSKVNVLIGSRRFAEGWDNYRASSLTLLRLGQGEGSLIIQMFGRVVRFAGVKGDGKRMESPPKAIVPLQTAYIYGLKSGYLDTFLQGLSDNGVSKLTRTMGKIKPLDPFPPLLQTVIAETPQARDFSVSAMGGGWLKAANPIRISLAASVASSQLKAGDVSHLKDEVGSDLTEDFKKRLALIDVDALYRHLVDFRRQQAHWWNFRFDRAGIAAALHSDRYVIFGLPGVLAIARKDDIDRINRMAGTIVRRLFESAYRKQESRHCRYQRKAAAPLNLEYDYYKEIAHGE